MDEPGAAAPRRPARAGSAWLAGGDGYVLRTVPSERSFLNGLGMWVAGMAIVSGFAMSVAASQWWSTSIVSVLWVLPIWAVLYCLIERLVLKSFGTSYTWNLLITIPRLVLSLAIALVVGLPMSQVIYSGSINDQLSKTATARIHAATNQITHLYDAKIQAAQKEIATVQAREAKLEQQVTTSKFLSEWRGRGAKLLADPQDRLRPLLQARCPAGGDRSRGTEERAPAVHGDDRRRPAEDRPLAGNRDGAARKPGLHDQGGPRLPRPPGGARAGREREPRGQEVRRVLPRVPDRDRPRRAGAQAHPSLQHRRRLRTERRRASGAGRRRGASSRGARGRPHSPDLTRGTRRGGRRRAQASGRGHEGACAGRAGSRQSTGPPLILRWARRRPASGLRASAA